MKLVMKICLGNRSMDGASCRKCLRMDLYHSKRTWGDRVFVCVILFHIWMKMHTERFSGVLNRSSLNVFLGRNTMCLLNMGSLGQVHGIGFSLGRGQWRKVPKREWSGTNGRGYKSSSIVNKPSKNKAFFNVAFIVSVLYYGISN